MTRSYPKLLYFSTAMALLGSLQFGFQIAVLNTSLDSVRASLNIPSSSGAIVVSMLLIGALFGSLGAGNLADKLGPKKATVLNTIPLALGSILCAAASSQTLLIFGRLLAGIGTGAASLFVPRYLNEIAPNPIRGLLGTLNQILINIGIVIAFALGWPYEANPSKTITIFDSYTLPWWRCMFAVGVLPAILQALGMALCPETPVWLLWSGLHLQATKSYRALHGSSAPTEDLAGSLGVQGEQEEEGLDSIEGMNNNIGNRGNVILDHDNVEAPLVGSNNSNSTTATATATATTRGRGGRGGGGREDAPEGSFKSLLNPKYRRIMILAVGVVFQQQLSGINTVILYGSEVFRKAGIASPILANLAMGGVNTAATAVAAVLMDRAGRKSLLTLSFFGMSAALGIMAVFLLLPGISQSFAALVALGTIFVYTIFFALGCGPVPWVYLPEILPAEIKGAAQSFCTAINWFGNFLVGVSFPLMLQVMGLGGSYAVYAALCCGSALFCRKYMVETKQRSLAAVHAELMRSSSD
jgi:MFS family permease